MISQIEKLIFKSLKTPAGELILGSWQDKLCLCDWRYRKMRDSIDERIRQSLTKDWEEGDSPVLSETESQLKEYFNGERKIFEIPLLPVGTDFQNQVWDELMKIPFGKTETYLTLARKLDNVRAIRAVASANGANAISIIIPCHRIIGSKGELVGYAGGLAAKKKLLQMEAAGREGYQAELFSN